MKKILSIVIFILLAVLIALSLYFYPDFYTGQLNKMKGIYYVYKGDKAYRKWDLPTAILDYQVGLKLYPKHYSAWTNLGNIYVVYEDYYSALEAYEKAIEANSKCIVARMNYGIISTEKLGNFEEAILQYDAIINMKRPTISIPFIYNNKKSTKLNKGLAYYNLGVAYKQKYFYANKASSLERREFLRRSLEAYQNAVKILKKDYDAIYNLALTQQIMGRSSEAGLNYCKAIEIFPMRYEAHYNLAILLKNLKFYEESLDELEKATMLITTNEGVSNRQRYIFDIMNKLTGLILENEKNNSDASSNLTYIDGKLIKAEELDKAILQNFRTCSGKKIFKEDISKSYETIQLEEQLPVRLPKD